MVRGPRASKVESDDVTLSMETVVEMFYPWHNIPQHAHFFISNVQDLLSVSL